MSFFNGIDPDERGMLHDLINLLLERINTQRRLNEDLSRQLESERERLRVLNVMHYGVL
jgi:hypothetical protein